MADRDREAEGRPTGDQIPEITGIRRNSQWDFPRRRALFTSDGTYSISSESDTSEGHVDRHPEGEYEAGRRTEERQYEDGAEELGFPHTTLERAVTQLQKELDDCRTEFEIMKRLMPAPAVNRRQPRQARFTSSPVPRYSGKSNWEQYRDIFEAIVCLNGWDDVTAALQLLSHLDGDALNVARLVPESQRAVPGFLINSLSDHYNSPGRRAQYKRQFQRVVHRPEDDLSVFAIELETLARMAFIDIDSSIQIQMVRDRFIDGQAECALRQHLDSLKPDTPMSDIVDSCRVWESHQDVETEPRTRADRRPVHAVRQVAVDEQIRTPLPETESLEDIISKLLPTPAPLKTRKDPIPSDRDLLVQRLLGTLAPSKPVVQERSAVTYLETVLLNWLPVGTVKEDTVVSPMASTVSAEICFSCRVLTHTTENCRTLDESFPFLPLGWQTERVGDQFILGPGSPAGPKDHETGNDDWSGERGWSPGSIMSTDPHSQ